jgi:hypothetical protein
MNEDTCHSSTFNTYGTGTVGRAVTTSAKREKETRRVCGIVSTKEEGVILGLGSASTRARNSEPTKYYQWLNHATRNITGCSLTQHQRPTRLPRVAFTYRHHLFFPRFSEFRSLLGLYCIKLHKFCIRVRGEAWWLTSG